MKTIRSFVLWWLAASVLLVSAAQAQSNTASAAPPPFKAEELDALLAPIALYPDSLLSQILMASTYPLEVVQAARWSKANPKLSGDAAVKKVEGESWDVSVKSLVAFPNVLEMMNEKLDWTQKLGDAFIGQQKDVMASIQRLRQLAKNSGNLESNQQQVVRTEAQSIIIEPAQPQTIYVPAYNPTVVYGAWPYPAYQPYYYPGVAAWYPGGALVSGFAWGLGFAAAGAMFGGWNWGHGDVNVNVNRATNIDRNYNRNNVNAGNNWQHNPQHRGNVGYRDQASRERYAGNRGADRGEFRGRDGERGGDRDGLGGDRGGRDGIGSDRGGRDGIGGDRGKDRDGIGGGDRGGNRDGLGGGDRGGSRDGVGGGGHRDGLPSHSQFERGGSGSRPTTSNRASAFDGVGGGNRDLDRGRASTSQMQRGGGQSFGGGGGGGGSRSFSGGGGGGGRAGGGGGGRGGRR
ncbi:DUF3300 domain-containing protein [Dechloromonas sp. H13]|uniref:DUF3300 domain-containing protein n=1 Tax=Dechloromonas sp. H13 TaxID=2570193 RepID=UPI001290A193|nr:DUF3300 domain-containing protein [Dechloromonas sp. H13]